MKKSYDDLEKEIEHLKTIIMTMIAWIASSAASPISQNEAKKLIEMLND